MSLINYKHSLFIIQYIKTKQKNLNGFVSDLSVGEMNSEEKPMSVDLNHLTTVNVRP